jgi:hypothetical protein
LPTKVVVEKKREGWWTVGGGFIWSSLASKAHDWPLLTPMTRSVEVLRKNCSLEVKEQNRPVVEADTYAS